jgi:NAD(P)H dehydrogenase (quinone)
VAFTTITAEEYVDTLAGQGLPRHVAEFITGWILAMEDGEFEYQSADLERLLGRKTKTLRAYIQSTLS